MHQGGVDGDYCLFPEGTVNKKKCTALFYSLSSEVAWHEDFYEAFNRRFAIPRLQAWYADEGIQYSYANNLLQTQPWLESLKAMKDEVEVITDNVFNSVLVTYYRNGHDFVDWHADDETELGEEPVIASLSLGATRTFQFRHRSKQRIGDLPLRNSDLLLMLPDFQKLWQHRVPQELSVNEPRINLTFRNVVNTK